MIPAAIDHFSTSQEPSPRPRPQWLSPGTIVGERYEIDGPLGAGMMGEIYDAHHVGLGKRVAIKVIAPQFSRDADASARFTQEARILAQIQHPAVVSVEHTGELPDGRAYFVMEYLRGRSLAERLARGHVPLHEALRILDLIARGLEVVHQQGIIHRDLKPDNTFLVYRTGEDPAVKILDFGLAKLARGSGVDQPPALSGSYLTVGTPLYMSPEQAQGPDVDHRTDIYALGCIAYELVLGVRPFPQAKSTPEVWAAHLHGTPILPRSIWPRIPAALDLLLPAMLAKDPVQRPTLAQVRSILLELRTSPPSPLVPIGRPGRTLGKTLRGLLLTLGALGILISGATLGNALSSALLAWRHTEPTTTNSVLIQYPPPGTPVTPQYPTPARHKDP